MTTSAELLVQYQQAAQEAYQRKNNNLAAAKTGLQAIETGVLEILQKISGRPLCASPHAKPSHSPTYEKGYVDFSLQAGDGPYMACTIKALYNGGIDEAGSFKSDHHFFTVDFSLQESIHPDVLIGAITYVMAALTEIEGWSAQCRNEVFKDPIPLIQQLERAFGPGNLHFEDKTLKVKFPAPIPIPTSEESDEQERDQDEP